MTDQTTIKRTDARPQGGAEAVPNPRANPRPKS